VEVGSAILKIDKILYMTKPKRQYIFLRRVGAYLIDCIVIFTLYVLSQSTLLMLGVQEAWNISENLYSYTFLTITLPFFLLFSLIEIVSDGVTPGKLVTRLKVVRGEKRKWWYIVRNIPKFLVWELFHIGFVLRFPDPTIWIIVLGYAYMLAVALPMFWTKGRRTLYDVVLDTGVVVWKSRLTE
jgi:uncharacterized RDD family membrane protein YckC